MKGKKILSLFLSFVMVISVVAGLDITTAFAETSEDGDWTYTISDDGTAVITAYNGSDTVITIPATVDGYTVTEVGFSSSSGSNSTITSITAKALQHCQPMLLGVIQHSKVFHCQAY